MHSWGQLHGALTSAGATTAPAPSKNAGKEPHEVQGGQFGKHAPKGPTSHPMHAGFTKAVGKDKRGRAPMAASLTGLKKSFTKQGPPNRGQAVHTGFKPNQGMGAESGGFSGATTPSFGGGPSTGGNGPLGG